MKNPRAAHGLVLFLGLLTLGGCARPAPGPLDFLPAEKVWNLFLAGAQEPPKAFELSASLHYSVDDQHRRMTLQFWGNVNYPLRLELAAGIGASLASWREDERGFVAFFQQENIAYVEPDRDRLAEGLGLPFTLRDLAYLVNGSYSLLAPARYDEVEAISSGYAYRFHDHPLTGVLLLAPDGRPLGFTSPDGVWNAELAPGEDGTPWRPRKITFSSADGRRLVLNVKQLETHPQPFPTTAMDLELPPDTRLAPLPNGDDGQPTNLL